MTPMVDDEGNIWEVDEAGVPQRLIAPAKQQAQGRVFTLPMSPKEARAEARAAEDQQFQRDNAARAERAADRADRTAQRQAAAAERAAKAQDKPTELQSKSAGFYGRLLDAEKAFSAVPETDRAPRSLLRQQFRDLAPGLENTLKNTPGRQQADQAIENFIAATLRLESGAAIAPSEFERQYRIFFPAPGDSPEVIAQKAASRARAIEGFRVAAGPLADQIANAAQQRANAEVPDPTVPSPLKAPPRGEDIDPTTGKPFAVQDIEFPTDDPAPDGTYDDSYASQGLSGFNEGLASVVGLPVDLTTAALNLAPRGLNAIANTQLPTIEDPILGSDWIKDRLRDIGSIRAASDDPTKQFTRRVGESVGAAAVPAGMAGSLRQAGAGLVTGLTGGIGGATAQQVAPGNPLAEILGEAVGGLAGGVGALKTAQRGAQNKIEDAIPTVKDLKEQASRLYQQAENSGAVANPAQTRQLADDFRQTLLDEGQLGPAGKITSADNNTSKAFNLIEQYADKPMKPKEMDSVRRVLADSRKSTDASDQRLGKVLLDQFDQWVQPLAPDFDDARKVSSRYLQAEDLEEARELAGVNASQFSGSGFENALRTQYRGLDRNTVRGRDWFDPAVSDAIQKVSRGTPASNAARGLGRLAPTGVVSGLGSVVPALAVGSSNPVAGGLVGGALAGAGVLGRVAATNMGIRNADIAELVARNGGAIPQAELFPSAFQKYAAMMAAVQQAKYLTDRPGSQRPE